MDTSRNDATPDSPRLTGFPEAIDGAGDLLSVLRVTIEHALAACGGDEISLHLVDVSGDEPDLYRAATADRFRTRLGLYAGECATAPDGAIVTAARTGEPILVIDQHDMRSPGDEMGPPTLLAVPVMDGDDVIGVLSCASRSTDSIGHATAFTMSVIAVIASDAIAAHVEPQARIHPEALSRIAVRLRKALAAQ